MSTLKLTNINSLTASTPPVINDSAGTQIGTFCRAWVNFNGTGVVAYRASFNVSNITDNGVGRYTVHFTTEMVDENYSISLMRGNLITGPAANGFIIINDNSTIPATTSFSLACTNSDNTITQDVERIYVAIFR